MRTKNTRAMTTMDAGSWGNRQPAQQQVIEVRPADGRQGIDVLVEHHRHAQNEQIPEDSAADSGHQPQKHQQKAVA